MQRNVLKVIEKTFFLMALAILLINGDVLKTPKQEYVEFSKIVLYAVMTLAILWFTGLVFLAGYKLFIRRNSYIKVFLKYILIYNIIVAAFLIIGQTIYLFLFDYDGYHIIIIMKPVALVLWLTMNIFYLINCLANEREMKIGTATIKLQQEK